MASLVVSGDTSGAITLSAPSVAGTNTLSLPAQTATLATLTTPSFATTIGVGGATAAASGAGITFPASQSASSDANTLDDYEEGTWTPSIGGNATYIVQSGYYRKIGSLVFISAYILINSKGTGSDTIISGLPFNPGAATSTNESVFAVSKAETLSASVTSISLRNNGTDIYSTYRTSASSSGTVNGAYIQNSTELNFSGCYLIY